MRFWVGLCLRASRRAGLPVAILAIVFGAGTARAGETIPPPSSKEARADRIVIEKALHRLSLFAGGQLLRSYQVALGQGGLAPKSRQGDKRTPEGHYRIDSRNANSAYHLSLHISYPEARDLAAAAARGDKAGGEVMIHGLRNGLGWIGDLHRNSDWTAGCIAVTDREIEEIWRLVPDGTPVEIRR